MPSLPNEFITWTVMGNDDCGNSIGKDREEKINEMQRTQCMGQQDKK